MQAIFHPVERDSIVQMREFEASRGYLSDVGQMLMIQLIERQRKQMKEFLKNQKNMTNITTNRKWTKLNDNAIYFFWDEMMIERQNLFRSLYSLERIKGGGEKASQDLIRSKTEICCYLHR